MAAKTRKKARPNRRSLRSRLLMRGIAIGALVLIGLFYYRPLQSYVSTKRELTQRATEVRALAAENRKLKRQLSGSTTGATLAAEARQLGWIRPGERLFIVKGIDRWRHEKQHPKPTTIGRSG